MGENEMAISTPIAVQQWVEKSVMKHARAYFGAATVNNRIYVFGGYFEGMVTSKDVEIYNPISDAWTKGPDMPRGRSYSSTAVLNGKVYLIGGLSEKSVELNIVDIFDPRTSQWETCAPMPTARALHRSVVLNGKIYVMGGTVKHDSINTMEIYDPVTDTWETGTPFPVYGCYGFATAVVQDKIYVFGGLIRTEENGNAVNTDNIYCYDVNTKVWVQDLNLPKQRMDSVGCVVNNKIYLIAGKSVSNNLTNEVSIFDTKTQTFSTGPNMITLRQGHGSVVIDNAIYAMGGFNNGQYINKMEAWTVITKPKLAVYLNSEESVQLSVSKLLADNENYTWTSSSEEVATVDTNGCATAVAPGLSNIAATNADDSFQESILVRVLPGTADLYRLAVHLTPGESKQLGMTEDLEGVNWKSMDESVVTVDTNGKITAVANGLAIIEATVGSDVQHIYVRVKAEV